MKQISGYIISIAFCMLAFPAFAQEVPDAPDQAMPDRDQTGAGQPPVPVQEVPGDPDQAMPVQDDPVSEEPIEDRFPDYFPGLRIGVNLTLPLMVLPEPAGFGLEAVADYSFNPEYFGVAEAGFSRRHLDDPGYQLRERGFFLRLGGDKNFYQQFNDVIAVGARLGFAAYQRSAPAVSLEPGYWGEYQGGLPADYFFRQWAEVVIVLKTEIFTNIFMGWNLRGKVLFLDKGDKLMDNRHIPGFGTSGSRTNAGFDFYIYYRIPFSEMKQK